MSEYDKTTEVLYLDPGEVRPVRDLQLYFQGKELVVKPTDTPYIIGRDEESCDLIVDNHYISRNHCVLSYNEDGFHLKDQSTNGTLVQFGRATPVRVHHETTALQGNGSIKLTRLNLDDEDLLLFKA